MPVDNEQLRATLEQLHEQLEDVEAVTPEIRDSLKLVLGDLKSALGRSPDEGIEAAEHESLMQRVQEAAGHFEESHPVLFGTLGKLIDMLSQMGI